MADIIQLLPDAVANQIAAGEVIQRPASVIKELVENAVDAGATEIIVIVKDAGKTLIQVIDNGGGMSETDARMAFERHATSKITSADDLFNIDTKGFRGEALASIAAIAHVDLKTRKPDDELGSQLQIEGSKVISQEPISCPVGSNFSVKNLFYNTPARRKFLKGDPTEFRHVITEIQRIALSQPEIAMRLVHNDVDVLNLTSGNHRQRIVAIFGRSINKELVSIKTETSIVKVHGFIGKPDMARRRSGEQYLFVNDRFFKSGYFHRAIMNAYEPVMQKGAQPAYFIYFDIDPQEIDVNIHPTKTEIKFADGVAIFQILEVIAKEGLGKFNIVPSLDFESKGMMDIPDDAGQEMQSSSISSKMNFSDDYQPAQHFGGGNGANSHAGNIGSGYNARQAVKYDNANLENWEQLYSDFEREQQIIPDDESAFPTEEITERTLPLEGVESEAAQTNRNFYQFKRKYILTTVKSGLMVIDQRRAHERILFELFLSGIENNYGVTQKTLFPKRIELPADDAELLREISNDLRSAGFDIDEFSQNSFVIQGTPADIGNVDAEGIIEQLIEHYKQSQTDIKLKVKEKVALSLAKTSAINHGRKLSSEEMQGIVDNLFACQIPNYSPDGKVAITIMESDALDKLFR